MFIKSYRYYIVYGLTQIWVQNTVCWRVPGVVLWLLGDGERVGVMWSTIKTLGFSYNDATSTYLIA